MARNETVGRRQLSSLEQVLDHCRLLGPLDRDEPPRGTRGVTFAGPKSRPGGNARSIWLQAHDDPIAYLEPVGPEYTGFDRWWWDASEALHDREQKFSRDELESLQGDFDALAATEYVLVIKTVEYLPPRHIGDFGRLDPGKFRGEAHLYRLADAEHLGAVRFTAVGETGSGPDHGVFDLNPYPVEESARVLADRFYAKIHEYARAQLASRSESIDANLVIERGGPDMPPRIPRR